MQSPAKMMRVLKIPKVSLTRIIFARFGGVRRGGFPAGKPPLAMRKEKEPKRNIII